MVNQYELTKEVGFVMGRRYYESPTNIIIVATSGSAVNILLSKPDYYDYVILDEIHEQTPESEQLLMLAKQLQPIYGFKLVLMSATLTVDKLLQKFPSAVHFEMS